MGIQSQSPGFRVFDAKAEYVQALLGCMVKGFGMQQIIGCKKVLVSIYISEVARRILRGNHTV